MYPPYDHFHLRWSQLMHESNGGGLRRSSVQFTGLFIFNAYFILFFFSLYIFFKVIFFDITYILVFGLEYPSYYSHNCSCIIQIYIIYIYKRSCSIQSSGAICTGTCIWKSFGQKGKRYKHKSINYVT